MSYEVLGEPDDSPFDAAIEAGWINPEDASKAIIDVMNERDRQWDEEGFTPGGDDKYQDGELERAGAAFALFACRFSTKGAWFINDIWPFSSTWWKPKSHRQNLVRAAALLVAAIEKIDRAEKRAQQQGERE